MCRLPTKVGKMREGIHTKNHIEPGPHSIASEPGGDPGGRRLHLQLQQSHLVIRTVKTATVLGKELQREGGPAGGVLSDGGGDKVQRSPCQLPQRLKAGTKYCGQSWKKKSERKSWMVKIRGAPSDSECWMFRMEEPLTRACSPSCEDTTHILYSLWYLSLTSDGALEFFPDIMLQTDLELL